MSSSAITTQVAQLKIGNVQNQADSTSVYSNGVWSFKNSTALTSVTIDNSGNVGVGVTPSAWGYTALQIKSGSVYEHSSTDFRILQNAFYATGNTPKYINSAAASMYRQDAGVHYWYNAVSGTAGNTITWSNPMTIDASGNLLVGTTTSPTNGRFAANGNSQVWSFGPNSLNSFVVYCQPAVGGNFGVYLNAGATSWTANSDERLKDISGEIKNATGIIKSLRAVHYTLKADEQEIKTERIGLIAQEVKAVVPQIVDENESGYLGVRYSEMVPVLVAAIQELSAKNEALEARLAALEAKP